VEEGKPVSARNSSQLQNCTIMIILTNRQDKDIAMKNLKRLFSSPQTSQAIYHYSVKCNRCGETINGRVNVYNDPSLEQDEKGKLYFICRKVLIGDGHCFQQIEVIFKFNEDREVLEKEIKGGEFL
jgi:hypothetical protein